MTSQPRGDGAGEPATGRTSDDSTASARDRRAYREFVRAHHPDVGGDPEEFVAGLARLRAQESRQRTAHQQDIAVYHRPQGVVRLVLAVWRTIERRRRPPSVR